MNFKQLTEEIKKQKQYASDDLRDANPQTLRNRIGRKNTAKLKIRDLFFEYRQILRSKVFAIAVVGENIAQFEAIAKENYTAFDILEEGDFYKHLVSLVDKNTIEKGETNKYLVDVMSRVLELTAQEIGIRSYTMPIYKDKFQGRSKGAQEIEDLFRRVIQDQVGDEMSAYFLLDKAARLAFDRVHEDPILPILIKVNSVNNLQGLISSLSKAKTPVTIIDTGSSEEVTGAVKLESVDEESVQKAFNSIFKNTKIN